MGICVIGSHKMTVAIFNKDCFVTLVMTRSVLSIDQPISLSSIIQAKLFVRVNDFLLGPKQHSEGHQ